MSPEGDRLTSPILGGKVAKSIKAEFPGMPDLFRHFWLMFVAVTAANVLWLKFRSARHIREKPELADGYRRLVFGYLFWGNLPWLFMGAAIELGGVSNVFSFFRPGDGNPLVLAWFAIVIAEWCLGFLWLFVWRGAEFLVEHPGVFRYDIKSPAIIKAIYCLTVAGGVAGVYAMFAFPPPRFIE
jgi:hypothetical protein